MSATGHPNETRYADSALDIEKQESRNDTEGEGRNVAPSDHTVASSKGAPAVAPASAGPRMYASGFWDPELKEMRKTYIIGMARVVLAISLLIWAVVPIYWGSLWKSADLLHNLNAYVINRDQSGTVGQTLTDALLSTNNNAGPHMTWSSIDPARYPTTADVENAVAVQETAWVIIDILADATSAINTARTSVNGSWDPSEVIQVYYSEARSQQAIDGPVLNSIRGVMDYVIPRINQASLANWLESNAGDAALLTSLATTAPQTLTGAVAVNYNNLRPWNEPVSIAPTFVGLIYLLVLAFNVTMANFGLRQGLQRRLRMRSFIMMRFFFTLPAYFFLSLMFSMVNIPFKVDFGGMGLGYGAGFMIWWCFTFLGMTLLGLLTELAVTMVGPQFIGFALVFLIIINVSVANLPIPLQVSLYKYGYAMPFYNVRQAYVTIIYNTGRHVELLKYMGILFAWLAVIYLTFPIWIWLERRREQKTAAAARAAAAAKSG